MRIDRSIEGTRLLLGATGLITLVVAACLLTSSSVEEGLRLSIRFTARTSLVLFLMAFSASAIHAQWPGNFSSWMVGLRRYIGLSFAASHFIHAGLFISLANLSPTLHSEVLNKPMLIFGGLGYFFIIVLALTSSDAMQKMLGMRTWRWLHLIGTHYIWIQFVISFGKRIPQHPLYWLPIGLLLFAMVLRLRFALYKRKANRSHDTRLAKLDGAN